MSGLWAVLFLWGCVCLCGPGPSYGALVISRESTTTQDSDHAGARVHKKRSTSDAEVEVSSVKVDCKVTSRFAHTVLTSTALNKASSSQEIFFEVEMPKTAFITTFSMEIDGQVYVGEVKEKKEARKQYEKAVSSGQTAGLVKASGRKMEKFSVSVNIASNSSVTFTLTYEELLQRKLGQYEIVTRVRPKQLIHKFEIVADVYEPQGIAFLDAYGTFITNELLPLVEKTVTDTKAHVSFCPTLDQQRACPGCDGTLMDGDFVIKYDVKRPEKLGDIQVVNGYFVHFFAPPDLHLVPKNVVFVIDRSGSMSDDKMRQTREALLTILGDLHEEDFFALIQFDDRIIPWRSSLSKATRENVDEAKEFVRGIYAARTTDINGALLMAVDMLVNDTRDNKLPERSLSMIILLTDGMPAGDNVVSNITQIQENVRAAIMGKMTLFCLGFGVDVKYDFLDVLATQNQGLARKIYEGADASVQLQGFYEEVASPLLSKVDLRYPDNAVDSLTTNHFSQLFNGSEIVVAGRLTDNDLDNFLVEVYAQGFDGDFQAQGQARAVKWDVLYPEQSYIFGDFTERMWAYLSIQQLLTKRNRGTPEEKSNATAQALEMSLRYGFVTPLTSMVVTKPETEDALFADKLNEDERGVPVDDSYGPSAPYFVDGDPHFMVELPEQQDALCFNIDDAPGTIFNLVMDPQSGVVVNGQTIGDKKKSPGGKMNTYFGRFGIVHAGLGLRLEVTTQDITVSQNNKQIELLWTDTASVSGPSVDLQVTKDHSLTVALRDSVKFVVLLHKVWKDHPYHRDYLGFYTLDSHLLSPLVHGLLGQFYHGVQFEVRDLRPGEVPEKPDATMLLKGQELTVTRGWQRDFSLNMEGGEKVPCWFVHNNGTGLIDGDLSDYVMSGLFETV